MLNNRVTLKGNLTRDPEYKTVSEKNLVTFRIAVNESIGNGKEETVFMDIDGWGSHAEYSQNVQLSKGDRVIIDGRLRQRELKELTRKKKKLIKSKSKLMKRLDNCIDE